MTSQQFEKLYTANEDSLRNVLRSQDIYDDDLFQDTCLALCEFAQHNEITNFWTQFMEKYNNLLKRLGQREAECIPYDNAQLAALEIIDESQDIEILDQAIDGDDVQFTAECECDKDKQRLHELLDYYYKHPQPGERNHKRACKVLKLYLKGKSEREIANCLGIIQPTVHQYIERTIERLKTITL